MRIYHTTTNIKQSLSPFFLALMLLVVTITVAACGTNAGSSSGGSTGSSSGSGTSSKSHAATVKGYGTAQGCPSDSVVSSAPPAANVVVKQNMTHSPIMAHVGDIIEIQLPFGHKWTGPNASQGNLEIQQPAGYAWKTDNICVWRFIAKAAGTTKLDFHLQALCKKGEMCPMYIAVVPFTITVK